MSIDLSFSKSAKREVQEGCHGGTGHIIFREIFNKSAFQGKLDFFHETSVPPGSEIGYHNHVGNEEVYYIVDGVGEMTLNGKRFKVRKGDGIIVHGGGAHGLKNNSKTDLKIVVFQASY